MALIAIHPGEHLAEEPKALNMSAAALARQLERDLAQAIAVFIAPGPGGRQRDVNRCDRHQPAKPALPFGVVGFQNSDDAKGPSD